MKKKIKIKDPYRVDIINLKDGLLDRDKKKFSKKKKRRDSKKELRKIKDEL